MSWLIYLIHFVANLRGPYPENLLNPLRSQSTWAVPWKSTWPIPWPVYKSRNVKIVISHTVANLHEPYRENLHDPFSGKSKWTTPWNTHVIVRDQSTLAVPWKSTWPFPCTIYTGRTVKIYVDRTVKIYTTHSMFSQQESYRENLHEPCRSQPAWCVCSPVYIWRFHNGR